MLILLRCISFGILFAALGPGVKGDYDCLCNYRVETTMYATPSSAGSTPVGYMYEFDCKPIVKLDKPITGWTAIMNEHKIAYVQMDEGALEIQICQGNVPFEDKLITTSSTTASTASTTTTTTTTPPPTTHKPTTPMPTTTFKHTSKVITKSTTETPASTAVTTSEPATMKPTSTEATHEISTSQRTTTNPTTKPTTAPRTTETTWMTTNSPNSFPTSTEDVRTTAAASWSTSHDWLIHWNKTHGPYSTNTPDWLIHWNKTHGPYTTNTPDWLIHWNSTNGPYTTNTPDWLIHWNKTHAQYTTSRPHHTSVHYHSHTTTPNLSAHGNLQKCPRALTNAVNHALIRQYKGFCYELVKQWKNWYSAETNCLNRIGHGGELLEIYTEDIQHYIQQFLRDANYNHGVWIGLQDIDREEHFRWDSGRTLTYTNWNPLRKGNRLPHGKEDCVFMMTNGQWEDSLCSSADLGKRFLVNTKVNVRRPFICQYPVHNINNHGR